MTDLVDYLRDKLEHADDEPVWLNPLPPIPREVYARTKERRHYGVEEQVAGAVEIGWVAAWHQALGYPTEDEE